MHQLSTSIGAVKGIKERAGKALKPGGSRYVVDFTILYDVTTFIVYIIFCVVAIVLDNMAYKVTKTIQGKRGKGGGFVR